MVQSSQQHVALRVKGVEWGLGRSGLRIVAVFWAGIPVEVTQAYSHPVDPIIIGEWGWEGISTNGCKKRLIVWHCLDDCYLYLQNFILDY